MLSRLRCVVALLLTLLPVTPGSLVAQDQGKAKETCLEAESGQLDELLAQVRRVVTREIPRAEEIRSGRGLVKGSAIDVVAVSDEAVCAKALRILKAHLGELGTVSDQVAVVRVQRLYIARYRFDWPAEYRRIAKPTESNIATFYFDRDFTRVHTQTW